MAELDGGARKPRVRSSVAGGVLAGKADLPDGLNCTPGGGIVLMGVVVRRLAGLAATTAGSLDGGTLVEIVGLDDELPLVELPLAEGVASTMRMGSSEELPDRVENDDVAGEGVELIGEVAAGVAEISLRIVPPRAIGFELASGIETMGGSVLDEVLDSVGVAAGGW